MVVTVVVGVGDGVAAGVVVVVVPAGAEPVDATLTESLAVEAALVPPALLATAVKVYDWPGVRPEIVHEPLAPVTVHVSPPGDAVTT